jgi:hypothetical protein
MPTVRDLDLPALAGRSVEEARAIVAAAGGVTRTVEPGGSVTLDYRPDRVTLVVAGGRVVATPTVG